MRPRTVLAAWTVSIIVTLAACASPPARGPRQASPPAPPPLGYASCEAGGPVAYIRIDVLTDPLLTWVVVAHEMMHMEQISRFPSCGAWNRWYSKNAASAEAEAFCASAKVIGLPQGLVYGARTLSGAYPFGLTYGEAYRLIEGYCR
jgi:hypothetical protein